MSDTIIFADQVDFWDYDVVGQRWRIGVTGERVCVVVPSEGGVAAERAMSRFSGMAIMWRRTTLGDRMASEVAEFLRGERKRFSIAPKFVGTEFECLVWTELMGVGYGERITYGELACRIGRGRTGSRAVGGAVARNPLLLMVPCHRVLASNGGIGGFSVGIDLKIKLLELEGGL